MKRYFVTGTDTGVGKTHVSCALLRRARELGRRVVAVKPIETGMLPDDFGSDRALLAAAAQTSRIDLEVLARPVSPLVAARAEGRTLDVPNLCRRIEDHASGAELVVIEGAGGWRVPITKHHGMGDLARMLGANVILVARAGLGTVNHTVLSIESIRASGVPLAAVLLSVQPTDDRAFAEENASTIATMTELDRLPSLIETAWPTELDPLL